MNETETAGLSPELEAYKSPDVLVHDVEQYLAAINAQGLSEEAGEALQRAFLKRCESNLALRLAFLEHPASGVNMEDPTMKKLRWTLRQQLAHPAGAAVS